jgi:hypothetical protein
MADDDDILPLSDRTIDIAKPSERVNWELVPIIIDIGDGNAGVLTNLLARGEPLSPEIADFVGALFRGARIGGYSVRLQVVKRAGAPKTNSELRTARAAHWVYWRINAPRAPKREQAVEKAAKRFHVDAKAVRKRVAYLEKAGAAPRRLSLERKMFPKVDIDTLRDFVLKTASGEN